LIKLCQNIVGVQFLAERYYVMFDYRHEPSVTLSSICDVGAHYPEGLNFRNIFTPSNSPGFGHFVLKFWGKNSDSRDHAS